MLKALENFDKLDDENKFRNWIFTIITNTYISYYRKRFIRKFISLDEYKGIDKLPDIYPRTDNDEIYIALSGLNEKEKISFLLFELGGFSIEEIRIIQKEKSQSAVKSRLSRTRDKLKNSIEKLESKKSNINRNKRIDNIELETARIINNIKPEKQGG